MSRDWRNWPLRRCANPRGVRPAVPQPAPNRAYFAIPARLPEALGRRRAIGGRPSRPERSPLTNTARDPPHDEGDHCDGEPNACVDQGIGLVQGGGDETCKTRGRAGYRDHPAGRCEAVVRLPPGRELVCPAAQPADGVEGEHPAVQQNQTTGQPQARYQGRRRDGFLDAPVEGDAGPAAVPQEDADAVTPAEPGQYGIRVVEFGSGRTPTPAPGPPPSTRRPGRWTCSSDPEPPRG